MTLTTRQSEVLQWRLMGFHTKAIAEAMHVSAKTVEYHWSVIKAKLGLQDVVEICCWFCKHRGISQNTVASNNATTPVARGRIRKETVHVFEPPT